MYMSLAGHRVRNGDTCLDTKGHRHNHLAHSDRRFQKAYPKSTCCRSKNAGQVAHVKSAGHLTHPPAYPLAFPPGRSTRISTRISTHTSTRMSFRAPDTSTCISTRISTPRGGAFGVEALLNSEKSRCVHSLLQLLRAQGDELVNVQFYCQ